MRALGPIERTGGPSSDGQDAAGEGGEAVFIRLIEEPMEGVVAVVVAVATGRRAAACTVVKIRTGPHP